MRYPKIVRETKIISAKPYVDPIFKFTKSIFVELGETSKELLRI